LNGDYDAIVVGGGIAGLLTALRLALTGAEVILLERDKLGSGATVGNHGTIHSGALYARDHPRLTSRCQEAMLAYRRSFPGAAVPVGRSWYFASDERLVEFERCWRAQGIAHDVVDRDTAGDVLLTGARPSSRCAAVADYVVSSRQVLVSLAQRCLDAGVTFATSVPVLQVCAESGRRPAVRIGLRESLSAEHVVLCCGLGIGPLVQGMDASLARRLRSRLAFMAVLPNLRLDRALFCLEPGGPTVVPTTGGLVLASLFGGRQPGIESMGKRAVPLALAGDVLNGLRRWVRPDVVDAASPWGYGCSKTEVHGPNYAVVDHGSRDGRHGLWSLVPGKMTFALHATRELVTLMRGASPELALPPVDDRVSGEAERLVATEPWQAAPPVRAEAAEVTG
jgi:glycine/D-amino acid oxidase-like deaminating enzyme